MIGSANHPSRRAAAARGCRGARTRPAGPARWRRCGAARECRRASAAGRVAAACSAAGTPRPVAPGTPTAHPSSPSARLPIAKGQNGQGANRFRREQDLRCFNRGDGRMPTGRDSLPPRCFYSGTEQHPLHVDRIAPETPRSGAPPIIMIHGAGHTGACFLGTPDGRPGWGDAFSARGHVVFVPDWPGHGRSPMNRDFARLSMRDVAASLLILVEEVGPAVLVVHSAAGPMAWWMTEQQPNLVAAIVGLAPGPPANLLPALPDDPKAGAEWSKEEERGHPIYVPETEPVWITPESVATYWANSACFPYKATEQYRRSIVPESARLFNERFNV